MILVAGASGRLGTELVPRLLARGHRVRALSRNPDPSRLPREVELVAGDLTDPRSLAAACRGADVVVAAATGFGPGGAGTAAVDETGNRNLVKAAEAAAASRFVLVSMYGAAPDHSMELMRRKFAAEQSLRMSALDWRIVRPTVFAELWSEMLGGPVISGRTSVVFGNGDNPVNFVSVSDVADAVVAAALEPRLARAVIPVAGPADASVNELLRLVGSVAGRQPRARHVPVTLLRAAAPVIRPVRRDLAGLLDAAVAMASDDMTFHSDDRPHLLPEVPQTELLRVVDALFATRARDYQSAERRGASTL